MTHPLAGIRVLDMSRVLAGPFAGRMLADLGADVVKVEPPEGDVTRNWGARIHGQAGYFNQQNVGKRGMCVNLDARGRRRTDQALAARADMLIENFRPDVMARLGLGYTVLRADQSAARHVVDLRLRPQRAGVASRGLCADHPRGIGAHRAAGAESPARPAADMAVSIADTNAALHGLVGVLAALQMRQSTGVGQHIDIAMIDSMLVTDDACTTRGRCGTPEAGANEVWDTAAGALMISGDFRHLWQQL